MFPLIPVEDFERDILFAQGLGQGQPPIPAPTIKTCGVDIADSFGVAQYYAPAEFETNASRFSRNVSYIYLIW